MSSDKVTIGVVLDLRDFLTRLVEIGPFASEIDAAKFSMAVAIRSCEKIKTQEGAETKWNIGSFDSDGAIRGLVESLYQDVDEPYRAIEFLINEGLRILKSRDDQGLLESELGDYIFCD